MLVGRALEMLGKKLQGPGPIITRSLPIKRVSSEVLLDDRYPSLRPLRVYSAPFDAPRVNLVTDSVRAGSLFGGVGTAIVFAGLAAKHLSARLRVVTRTEKADQGRVYEVLKRNAILWSDNIDFSFVDVYKPLSQLDVADHDIFITTSWWTTWSTKASVPDQNIIYLLQEDERMFYPFGDDHLRCSELMASTGPRFVINSRILFEHLVADGFDNIARSGVWFEPAFPARSRRSTPESADRKRNLLFYARPNNARNLFYLGVEILDEAIRRGVLDLERWELHFVGKDVPALVFSNGYSPRRTENLPWGAYFDLISTMDVGLCLMYSPHPSYPPLDLAATGAIVVTNRFGRKQDLTRYSNRIICSGLDRDELVASLGTAMDRAKSGVSIEPGQENGLKTDWHESLAPVLSHLFR